MIGGTRYTLTAEIARQSQLSQQIARDQSDISSQKRLQVASDDPGASARVADIRRTQANEATWSANVDAGSAMATRADSTLTGVATIFDRAKELMLNASSNTNSDSDRASIANELRGLVQEIDTAAAQTDSRGQPLFATGTAPQMPIGYGQFIAPTDSRDAIFSNVQTAAGPKDLRTILSDAADAISLPDTDARNTASTASLAELDAGAERIAIARGDQGVRANRLDAARERFAGSGLVLTEERSGLEDTDITTTVAQLQARMLSLNASQTTFARISKQTLFDLLG